MHQHSPASGFTILELSIVIGVVALVIGGILVGNHMIHLAELRAAGSDAAKYSSAAVAFRQKYNALPGDLSNATAYWGASADCGGFISHNGPEVATCDGNGDGNVDERTVFESPVRETWTFWQHLANAGMIEGTYSGGLTPLGGTNGTEVLGVSSPKARVENAGYSVTKNVFGEPWSGDLPKHYAFLFGGISPTEAVDCPPELSCDFYSAVRVGSNPVLTANEASEIDQKLDDGKPAYGKVKTLSNVSLPDCTTTASAATAEYAVANSGKTCSLVFVAEF